MEERAKPLHTLDPWIAERHVGGSIMIRSGHHMVGPHGTEIAFVFREVDAKRIRAVPELLRLAMVLGDALTSDQFLDVRRINLHHIVARALRAMEKPIAAEMCVERKSASSDDPVDLIERAISPPAEFWQWPPPLPITDAQKTGKQFLLNGASGWVPGSWRTVFGCGWQAYGWIDDHGNELFGVTHYLPMPPDLRSP